MSRGTEGLFFAALLMSIQGDVTTNEMASLLFNILAIVGFLMFGLSLWKDKQ